jgi:hypothetical protein
MFEVENDWKDFDYVWHWHYAGEGYTKLLLLMSCNQQNQLHGSTNLCGGVDIRILNVRMYGNRYLENTQICQGTLFVKSKATK